MNPLFVWPGLLWGLLAIPAGWVVYRRLLAGRRRAAVAFPDGDLLAAAAGAGSRRRHLPAALFLTALAMLIAALARPVAPLPVPADRSAIMLSIDISGSMRSQDVLPNRLEAAKESARAFLRGVPPTVRVGLVTFGGYATLISPPTTDRDRLFDALEHLYFIRRTAIGDGLMEAVAALPGRVKPGLEGVLPPAPPGSRPPGVVILLSDGRSNSGMDPLGAADLAKRQDVVVYTVGVGQTTPGAAWTLGGTLDEETLQTIARDTGGQYYHASSAQALHGVYRRLARIVGWERRPEEVTGIVGAMGAAALIAAIIVARLRTQPLPV
jgi:Ca-activated chloride channel family protein